MMDIDIIEVRIEHPIFRSSVTGDRGMIDQTMGDQQVAPTIGDDGV
jgi:hypothetical protein